MGLDAAVPALGCGGAGLLARLVHIAARCDRGRGQIAAIPAASAIGNAAQKAIPWGRKELTAPWTLPDAAETAWEILLEIPAQQQTGGLLLQVGSCFALELTLASRTLHAYARDSGEQTMQDCGTLQLAPGAPVRLQVFLDRCSAEIFADGKCLSVNVFDTAPLRPVSLIPQGGTLPLQLLQVWQLQHVMEPQT